MGAVYRARDGRLDIVLFKGLRQGTDRSVHTFVMAAAGPDAEMSARGSRAEIGADRASSGWQTACVYPCIMPAEDADVEQVDLLVRELMAKPRAPVAKAPAAELPGSRPALASSTMAQPAGPMQSERRAGRRWSNVFLLMPSRRHPDPGPRVALESALRLPRLPGLIGFVGTPGPVAMVRIWVGLGVVYSASLSFWPYPKTYLWGMVLYLLSLGLLLVCGVWGARLTWQARLGAAHTVALGTVFWAVGLAAVETLPLQ
jgi:hypothetical protein